MTPFGIRSARRVPPNGSLRSQFRGRKLEGMRIMRLMRQFRGVGGLSLFCMGLRPCTALPSVAKQILGRSFGVFCLILPHYPHVFRFQVPSLRFAFRVSSDFMRIMRVHEGGLFIGAILPCGFGACAAGGKHEAGMRVRGGVPHVFGTIGG